MSVSNTLKPASNEYKATAVQRFPQLMVRDTAEVRYWKKFKNPVVERKPAPVTAIDFCPTIPYDFVVTSSTRVHVYSCRKNTVSKTFSRFKDVAYSGTLRNDGKLLAAGCKVPVVKIFQTDTKAQLRILEGHTRPVQVVKWAVTRKNVFSCSDDNTARYWDIASGKCTGVFKGHEDYVRCASSNPANLDTWITGSMDRTIKLWDIRSPQKPVVEMNHGDPVNAVICMPGGGLLISAGGNEIKVWDILGGGRLVRSWSNHQKTITSLCLDGTENRILSAGLDGHVKIYDAKTYQVAHGLKYEKPILALGVSPNNGRLVVGMNDGTLSIRNRDLKSSQEVKDFTKKLTEEEMTLNSIGYLKRNLNGSPRLFGGTFKFFSRGKNAKAGVDDFRVEIKKKKKLQKYDKLLKQFHHRGALDAALATRQPAVVASMLSELVARGTLSIALSGRDDTTLEPVMSFLIKYITNPRYSKLLIGVCTELIGIYTDVLGQSPSIDDLIFKLNARIKEEVELQTEMLKLIGALDIVLAQGQVV